VDTPLLLAFGIGVVSGLRTFTSLAAVMLMRGGVWGIVLAVFAFGEYVADASPKIGSRTAPASVAARALSGTLAGAFAAAMHGVSPLIGASLGIVGALVGTYGGHAARLAAIGRIGAIPAAIAEDVVAMALAALIVTR
jgi:uncharacterized membrane protein